MGEKEVLNKAKWEKLFPSINKALGHSYNAKDRRRKRWRREKRREE